MLIDQCSTHVLSGGGTTMVTMLLRSLRRRWLLHSNAQKTRRPGPDRDDDDDDDGITRTRSKSLGRRLTTKGPVRRTEIIRRRRRCRRSPHPAIPWSVHDVRPVGYTPHDNRWWTGGRRVRRPMTGGKGRSEGNVWIFKLQRRRRRLNRPRAYDRSAVPRSLSHHSLSFSHAGVLCSRAP